ncbi:hypothetical protein [Micromonospora sp. NPDC048898]|uniref:hypothetical protein n=1 Tax=Micromonospora sp. NPDC048898 TaxID=3364260 RepID=UPI00371A5631
MYRTRPLLGRLFSGVLALGIVTTLAVPQAVADPPNGGESLRLLAKAAPDECFAGIGVPYPPGPPCAEGQPKVNQAYVWGLAQTGRRLWFGTGANVLCLKPEGYNVREPILNDDYACEYGDSQPAQQNPQLPATLGDHRPPQVFTYDLSTDDLRERTADIVGASEADADLLRSTAGLRAAAAHHGVVLLGGPSVVDGVNLFAFDSFSGRYLGSANLTAYQNIRHFTVAAGELYAGVGLGVNGGESGQVLRWTGNRAAPFTFVEVGDLPTQVADITAHHGRIYVTTWPKAIVDGSAAAPVVDTSGLASVWMSPPLATGAPGLTVDDAHGWTQVWTVGEYEPDPVVAQAYALGGLASFDGHLYWGTMHVPLQATALHLATYPPRSPAQVQATVQNTQRALGVFRGRAFGTAFEQVETLYGESELPAFDPTANGGTGAWASTPTGQTPRYGESGFGDPFNLYAWKMAVAGDRLYIGTMDFAYISLDGEMPTPDPGSAEATPPTFGADLWAFDSADEAARPVDTTGLGNPLNQGVRTMIPYGSTLYVGTANPMNLRADPTPGVPKGGWELIELTRP